MADLSLKLRWKVTTTFQNPPPIDKGNVVFNLSPNTGLYSQFSIPIVHSYVPSVLSPTVTYHQVIRNLLKKNLDIEISERKFPYRVFVSELKAPVLLNLRIRFFAPIFLSITVKLSEIPTSDLSVSKLIDFQRLDNLRPVSNIVQWTIGMVETLDHRDFEQSHPLSFKPAIHLDRVSSQASFSQHIEDNISKYVGILIRNYQYELMDRKISKNVFAKNQAHNLKSSQELLLIDKQGILYLTPEKTEKGAPARPKFSRTYDLFGIALTFDAFLDHYHIVRQDNEDYADFILYKIQPWIDESDTVFSASLTNKLRWNLILEEFSLKSRLRSVMNQTILNALEEKRPYFDQFTGEWWEEKDFGHLISKKISESQALDLSFLADDELRKLILEDYAEARLSYRARNYKSTIILCGSVVEALLVSAIETANINGITTNKLYRMGLSELIKIARDNNLIKDKTLLFYLEPLRHYRNMIHPGVQLRKSLIPDSPKARISLETVNLLVRDLNKN